MSDPAPAAPHARRRGVVAASVVAAVLVATLIAVLGSERSDHDSVAGLPAAADRDPAAGRALDTLARAVADRDRAAFVAAWAADDAAQHEAAGLYDRLAGLGVAVRLRLGRPVTPVTTQADQPAWASEVTARWRLRGVAGQAARAGLDVSFTMVRDRATVVAIAPHDLADAPIWLTGEQAVVRTRAGVVVAADPATAGQLAHEVALEAQRVARTIDDPVAGAVVYLPPDEAAFESLLHASPGEYNGIGGVSTAIDGSHTERPRMVVLNPDAYAALSGLGRRVLVAHELTHVAVGTPDGLPLWLTEGFADFAALRFADAARPQASAAALARVASEGAPRRLPADDDFAVTDPSLESTYELSWLAVRMLARDHGVARVAELYAGLVRRPGPLDARLHAVLGTSLGAVTRDWRAYLEELADGR